MNAAVIAAAGWGTRLGREGGKQFIRVNEKPLLAYTLEAFERATGVDSVIVVTNEDHIEQVRQLAADFSLTKVDEIVAGGAERQESVYKGLLKTSPDTDAVVIHDGARPLIQPALIDEAIRELAGADGVVVAIPVKDTLKIVDDNLISGTLDRHLVYSVQTPQVFKRETLLLAHKKAANEGFIGTDDSTLVERLGLEVKVIPGSDENIKVTTSVDLLLAEVLISRFG